MGWDGEASAVDPSVAADAACATVEAWAKLAGCTQIIACLTGRENFRKRILASYKHTRVGKAKPQCYGYVIREMENRFDTRLVPGLEGDDLLGILATTDKYTDAVVVSIDKDMRGVPGYHLNPLKEDKPVLVGLAEADYWWLTQTLTGDTSDGYTGLPKCGPKGALKALGAVPYMASALWPKVVAAYRAAGLTEDDALIQARVARILRRSDYDKTTKEIRLWHPTEPVCIPVLLAAS